jgi:hypothetical protein
VIAFFFYNAFIVAPFLLCYMAYDSFEWKGWRLKYVPKGKAYRDDLAVYKKRRERMRL